MAPTGPFVLKDMNNIHKQILEEYISGVPTSKLATKYNISKSTIRRLVKQRGVSKDPGGSVTYDVSKAIQLWESGNTLDQIAAHFGVNRTSVHEQLKKNGIDTSRRIEYDREVIHELLSIGYDDCSIAEVIGGSAATVARIRREEFGIRSATYIKSQENKGAVYAFTQNNPNASFDDVRCQFPHIDYGSLTKWYDDICPGRREFKHRLDLIKTLDDQRVDELVTLLKQGYSRAEIMKQFPITTNMLTLVVEARVPDYSPKQYKMPDWIHRNLSDVDWCKRIVGLCNDVNREYTGAAGIANIECRGLVSPDTVRTFLSKHGLHANAPALTSTVPELTDVKWLTEQYKTKSYAQIADGLGVSHPTVRQALIDGGIEIKRDHLVSKIEKQLLSSIEQIYQGTIIENDRALISPQEIDILLPDLKIGIEVCGLYWHSEKFKDNNYHLKKLNAVEAQGYRLITIFEDEWAVSPEKVISKLKAIIGLNQDRVYARMCNVVEISNDVAQEFFIGHHIQDYAPASKRYGLIDRKSSELVAAMTFKQLSNNVFDLSRFASAKQVVGGFSKLLSHFKSNNDWNRITTFADLRWSSRHSNVYKTNGFAEVHITRPAYYYVDRSSKRRLHRMQFQKKNLATKLKVYDATLTERENANRNGFLAIYDCGHIKYELRNAIS